MSAVVFAPPWQTSLGVSLAARLGAQVGDATIRQFPDEETYVRVVTPVAGQRTLIVASLDRPDSKVLPLLYLAQALRDQGAESVGLVAPYLAYMRQDLAFLPGEAVTSRYFAKLLSQHVDWLVTVDPHLHRIRDLSEVYTIPNDVVHAAPAIAAWVAQQVPTPIFVGPDEESEQWVAAVARMSQAPHTVLRKVRRGDRDVEVSLPDAGLCQGRTPVLIDDIVSTARTMIETVGHLKKLQLPAPICIGVHGIFAGSAYEELQAAGAARIVTTTTVPHGSNAIDMTATLAEAAAKFLR